MSAAPFCRLTVPTDGSTASASGIRYALDLARQGGASIAFCSVVDTLAAMQAGSAAPIDPQPIIDAMKNDARRFCDQALEEARKVGIAAESRVAYGRPVDLIVTCAQDNRSDAIVIGTNARTGIARAAFGSVTEELLRVAEVPVVVVHEDDAVRAGAIAVAVDGSPASRAALETAIAMGRALGCGLCLISVVAAHREDALAAARQRIAEASERARAGGVVAAAVVADGDVVDVLLAEAARRGCSSFAVGTHGRSGIARFFLGSVAAALVEKARLPVVVVREPHQAEEAAVAALVPAMKQLS